MSNTEQLSFNPTLYVRNFIPGAISGKLLSYSAGECRDSTNTFDIEVPNVTNFSVGINGLNGLDTGTIAASTWYYVYAIGSSMSLSPSGLLLSLSNQRPTMPFNCDGFRLIGAELTDGSSNFVNRRVVGINNERSFIWDSPPTVLTNGAATTPTAIDLSSAVPVINTTIQVLFDLFFTPNAAGDRVLLISPGSSFSSCSLSGSVAAVPQSGQLQLVSTLVTSLPEISYSNSAASGAATIKVSGFSISL